MRSILAIAAAAVALGTAVTAASALPASGALDLPKTDSLVEKVHDWHNACVWGPAGWHYHSRLRGRVSCRPVRPTGNVWIWRSEGPHIGWWHPNERRFHHIR